MGKSGRVIRKGHQEGTLIHLYGKHPRSHQTRSHPFSSRPNKQPIAKATPECPERWENQEGSSGRDIRKGRVVRTGPGVPWLVSAVASSLAYIRRRNWSLMLLAFDKRPNDSVCMSFDQEQKPWKHHRQINSPDESIHHNNRIQMSRTSIRKQQIVTFAKRWISNP